MLEVKRMERGWAGHYCCANRCLFRRNTLLECGETRIVVSTIGEFLTDERNRTFDTVGLDRNYETMAFHAERVDGRFWDADVTRGVDFCSQWAIKEHDRDDKANDMHEAVVAEITERLAAGDVFPSNTEED